MLEEKTFCCACAVIDQDNRHEVPVCFVLREISRFGAFYGSCAAENGMVVFFVYQSFCGPVLSHIVDVADPAHHPNSCSFCSLLDSMHLLLSCVHYYFNVAY